MDGEPPFVTRDIFIAFLGHPDAIEGRLAVLRALLSYNAYRKASILTNVRIARVRPYSWPS